MTDSTDVRSALPKGWANTRLGALVKLAREKLDPSAIERVPYIGLEHIEKDTGRLLGHGYSEEVRSTKSKFRAGDLLYGKLRPYLNKVYIPDFDGISSTDILVFAQHAYMSYGFLKYRLLAGDFVRYANQNVSGVQHPRVDYETLSQYPILLPPLAEQHRIVAKIEELFTQLDAGVAALQRVKAQLRRYRRAVLAAAFEGRLTAAWREAHRDELEPASALLEHIRAKQEKVRTAKLSPPDVVDSSGLPYGWAWCTVGFLAESMKNGLYKPSAFYSDDGVACLRMYNIESGYIVWKDIRRMTLTADEFEQFRLLPGDILINRVNSRELVGKAAVVPDGLEPCIFEAMNIRLRVHPDYVNSKYVNFWILLSGHGYFDRAAQQTVGMASINQEQLAAMRIPIPPVVEQEQIVVEIERLLSVTDDLAEIADQCLNQSDRLRQSILKRAFEGRLVPQDPTDEPAEALLARIRAAREGRPKERVPYPPPQTDIPLEQGRLF